MSTEYQTLIDQLDLRQGAAAKFLGVSLRTSNNWGTGSRPVPLAVLKLLRTAVNLGGVEKIDAFTRKMKQDRK